MLHRTKSKRIQVATLWLDPTDLYVGVHDSNGELVSIHAVRWNPENASLYHVETAQCLTQALQGLVKQLGLQRYPVKLCLDDTLCVTRVTTGERSEVERELENIQVRSQLYLSLGLGDKLTGSLRESNDGQAEYALTSIVNLQTMQWIQNAIHQSRLKLISIEPVALAITRALGLLGLDREQPILFASVGSKRCDLAIARSGRLMLSYPIAAEDSDRIAKQIGSHMTRLKRFCQRYRLQEGSKLDSIYVFGDSEAKSKIHQTLESASDQIKTESVPLPSALQATAFEGFPESVLMALWSCGQSERNPAESLSAPDLLDQLLATQHRSITERLLATIWPAGVAAALIACVLVAQWANHRRLANRIEELATFTADISMMEQELAEWELKDRFVQAHEALEKELQEPLWVQVVQTLAPCLPGNARLDSFTLSDSSTISLRGTMTEGDKTYEMLAALKQLPYIQEVAVESVSSIGNASLEQFQFEVKCKLLVSQLTPKGSMVSHHGEDALPKTSE